jgi:hypothetical protein
VIRRVALLFVAATLAAVPAAVAQSEAASRREARHEALREALRMVDAYLMSNLQPSLGLTDAEYVKVLPLVQKLQKDRREFQVGRMRLVRQLRRQLRSGAAGEADVVKTLDELKSLDATGLDRTRADADDLDRALTPLQQAKFRVLELEVEQRLRELTNRVRQRGDSDPPARE